MAPPPPPPPPPPHSPSSPMSRPQSNALSHSFISDSSSLPPLPPHSATPSPHLLRPPLPTSFPLHTPFHLHKRQQQQQQQGLYPRSRQHHRHNHHSQLAEQHSFTSPQQFASVSQPQSNTTTVTNAEPSLSVPQTSSFPLNSSSSSSTASESLSAIHTQNRVLPPPPPRQTSILLHNQTSSLSPPPTLISSRPSSTAVSHVMLRHQQHQPHQFQLHHPRPRPTLPPPPPPPTTTTATNPPSQQQQQQQHPQNNNINNNHINTPSTSLTSSSSTSSVYSSDGLYNVNSTLLPNSVLTSQPSINNHIHSNNSNVINPTTSAINTTRSSLTPNENRMSIYRVKNDYIHFKHPNRLGETDESGRVMETSRYCRFRCVYITHSMKYIARNEIHTPQALFFRRFIASTEFLIFCRRKKCFHREYLPCREPPLIDSTSNSYTFSSSIPTKYCFNHQYPIDGDRYRNFVYTSGYYPNHHQHFQNNNNNSKNNNNNSTNNYTSRHARFRQGPSPIPRFLAASSDALRVAHQQYGYGIISDMHLGFTRDFDISEPLTMVPTIHDALARPKASILSSPEIPSDATRHVVSLVISYRHTTSHRDRMLNVRDSQWSILLRTIRALCFLSGARKFRLWTDRMLSVRQPSQGLRWVTASILPFMAFPVLYLPTGETNISTELKHMWLAVQHLSAAFGHGIIVAGSPLPDEMLPKEWSPSYDIIAVPPVVCQPPPPPAHTYTTTHNIPTSTFNTNMTNSANTPTFNSTTNINNNNNNNNIDFNINTTTTTTNSNSATASSTVKMRIRKPRTPTPRPSSGKPNLSRNNTHDPSAIAETLDVHEMSSVERDRIFADTEEVEEETDENVYDDDDDDDDDEMHADVDGVGGSATDEHIAHVGAWFAASRLSVVQVVRRVSGMIMCGFLRNKIWRSPYDAQTLIEWASVLSSSVTYGDISHIFTCNDCRKSMGFSTDVRIMTLLSSCMMIVHANFPSTVEDAKEIANRFNKFSSIPHHYYYHHHENRTEMSGAVAAGILTSTKAYNDEEVTELCPTCLSNDVCSGMLMGDNEWYPRVSVPTIHLSMDGQCWNGVREWVPEACLWGAIEDERNETWRSMMENTKVIMASTGGMLNIDQEQDQHFRSLGICQLTVEDIDENRHLVAYLLISVSTAKSTSTNSSNNQHQHQHQYQHHHRRRTSLSSTPTNVKSLTLDGSVEWSKRFWPTEPLRMFALFETLYQNTKERERNTNIAIERHVLEPFAVLVAASTGLDYTEISNATDIFTVNLKKVSWGKR